MNTNMNNNDWAFFPLFPQRGRGPQRGRHGGGREMKGGRGGAIERGKKERLTDSYIYTVGEGEEKRNRERESEGGREMVVHHEPVLIQHVPRTGEFRSAMNNLSASFFISSAAENRGNRKKKKEKKKKRKRKKTRCLTGVCSKAEQ